MTLVTTLSASDQSATTIVVDAMDSSTVVAAFEAAVASDPTRPLVTYYDDDTGERTELSGATLGNWVAKTANLLVDGLGLGAGDTALVLLPPHWQTAAVLLGCWSAGLCVDLHGGGERDAQVAFATADKVPTVQAVEVYALALAPLAAPFRPGPPEGSLDFVVEVRGHADDFRGPQVTPDHLALADGTSHAALVAATAASAIPTGARVLIDGDANPDPVDWLVAPLLRGASIVLCRHLDRARLPARLATERAITVTR